MEEAIAEGAICGVVVVPGRVELVEAIPTEFVVALHTLHVFAASGAHDANVAPRARLCREDLEQVAEQGQLAKIEAA